MSLNILTINGIRNFAAQLSDKPNLLVTADGCRFKVRQSVTSDFQLSLFVFEAVGYFAKRSAV